MIALKRVYDAVTSADGMRVLIERLWLRGARKTILCIDAALYERFSSRGESDFQDKLLSAMRYELGGYLEKSTK